MELLGQGGVLFRGDTSGGPTAAVPFGRFVNNTVYGQLGGQSGVGLEVGPNASPTILNNIFANHAVGIHNVTATGFSRGAVSRAAA